MDPVRSVLLPGAVGIVVVILLEYLHGYLRRRRTVRILVIALPDRTRVLDSSSNLLAECPNTLVLQGPAGCRKVLECGRAHASAESARAGGELVDLVRQVDTIPEGELESLWAALLTFCCADAHKQLHKPLAFLDVRVRPHTGNAKIDDALARIVHARKVAVVGSVALE
jgi:hypothetical protein